MVTKKLVMKDDIMFKAFFSRKGNERFLKDFLNAILGKEIKINRVIHDLRLEQLAREQKYGVLDLDVELESGEIINIEMQMDDHQNMEKRTTFYASKKITEQLGPKAQYSDLKKIIVIAILNYSFIDLPEYVTKTVRVVDKHREYEINNDVTYYYIELKKFRNQNPDMKEPINQWLAFIDMERGDLLEMAEKENELIKEAKETYEVLTGDDEVKRLAEIRLMSHLEEQAALECAREKGQEKGMQEGIEKGMQEGLEKGKKEGLEQGKKEGLERGQKEEKIKTAKRLLKLNLTIAQIVEATQLDKEEILKLKDDTTKIQQDFRGHSRALRYICEKNNQKYFIKIYNNNRIEDLLKIENVYKKTKIPTARIIEKAYLEEIDKTYVVYEYIEGKTLKELTKELEIEEIEKIGNRVGNYLARLKAIKGKTEDVKNSYELEFKKLTDNLYFMKNQYEEKTNKKLAPIDLERLCKNFSKYKEYVYKLESTFIHGDINLSNVIVKDGETYFIDTDGGKFSFRSLDFRGNCWYGWDGDNKEKEQAMFHGIYKGLFDANIPDEFNKELAFTVIYEFLLKVYEPNKTGNLEKLEATFNKFNDIFVRTNYFENYKFEWLD